MVVDDDEICLMMHTRVIINEALHESPMPFNSAEKALAYLHNLPDKEVPALIFLDINMPDMDGWEFLDLLHQEEFTQEVYVVVLSSSVDIRDKEKAASYVKVIDFIEKPFINISLKTLRSKIPGS
jgi:CheY-like chemotaxis protein